MSMRLTMAPPVISTTTAQTTRIDGMVKDWRRSWRMQGGPWEGTFTLTGKPATLLSWFNTRLGWHIEERSGGRVTWDGMIYEMELRSGGVSRRRSLDAMYNWSVVACEGIGYSTVYEEARSQARYGRRQSVIRASVDTTDGNRLAEQFLDEHAWPWARPLGIWPSAAEPQLSVTVCGYAFTLNWETTTFTESGTSRMDVSERVDDVLDDALVSGFIGNRLVRENTYQMLETYSDKLHCWDYLMDLVAFGDGTGAPWRVWVEPGRRVRYEPVNLDVRYHLRNGELLTPGGGKPNPWLVTPGVVRDLSYSVRRSEPGSFLDDARDILVDEVVVSGDGELSLRTADYSESDLIQTLGELDQARRRAEDAERQREEREAWERDYLYRKQWWESQHPGEPFTGREDQPWW